MNAVSIKAKVIGVLIVSLTAGAAVQIGLVRNSYERNVTMVAGSALTLLISVAMAVMLNRLVFARLRRTMDIVTRVMGGEFSHTIVPSAADEVGRLEELFEQFRTIFVGLVDDVSKQQSRDAGK